MFRLSLVLALTSFYSSGAYSQTTVINFDSDLASYVAPPRNSTETVEITTQFASLGVVFSDLTTPGRGPEVINDISGFPIPTPVNILAGFSDSPTDPNGFMGVSIFPFIEIAFVDPKNPSVGGSTTMFSVLITDTYAGSVTAYDISGNLLDSADLFSTQQSTHVVSFTSVGNISRVVIDLRTEATGIDDIVFGPVTPVPEPRTCCTTATTVIFVLARKYMRSTAHAPTA